MEEQAASAGARSLSLGSLNAQAPAVVRVGDVEVLPPEEGQVVVQRLPSWREQLLPLLGALADVAVRQILPWVLERAGAARAMADARVDLAPRSAGPETGPVAGGGQRHRARRRGEC